MNNKELFGQRLNTALAARGLQQIDLARAIGYKTETANTISYWCSGARTPNLEQLIKITEILGVSADYLLGRSDVMTPDTEIQAICNYTGLSDSAVDVLHVETASFKNTFLVDILSSIITDEGLVDLLSRCDTCIKQAERLEKELPQYTDEQLVNDAAPLTDQLRYSLYDINDSFRELINRLYPVDKTVRRARKKINEASGNLFDAGFDEGTDDDEG